MGIGADCTKRGAGLCASFAPTMWRVFGGGLGRGTGSPRGLALFVVVFVATLATGCIVHDGERTPCECGREPWCAHRDCLVAADAGTVDVAGDTGVCEADRACGADCCGTTELCIGRTCVRDGGPCASNEDCRGDTYCDPELERCVPYGTPPWVTNDPTCRRLVIAGTFSPTVQCHFHEAPPGDAWPEHLHVLSTPMVADFGIGRGADDPIRPSIIAVFDDGVDGGIEQPTGVIRILDGGTCVQTAELGSLQLVSHSSPPAIGDLTGDGLPEIVANQAGGGVVAFTYTWGAWAVLWRSTNADGSAYRPTGGGWAGPSLVDLDDDGRAEVIRGGIVLDSEGVLVDDTSLGLNDYADGVFAIVADVDADGELENVSGNGVFEWDRAGRYWLRESWSPPTPNGHAALADFGDFPGAHGWPAETPEVAVIGYGTARVQTLDGVIVFGPISVPNGGLGGPPTIADFDGDGRVELAAAGVGAYTVFDLDCMPSGATGTCESHSTNGILWSVESQDGSSGVTGSSVFDFEGDGRAEAVYGDECFLRVYDGRTGAVIFSQARSSCTWYESPVVADLDGDYNAEIVIGDNLNCGPAGHDCADPALGPGLGPRNTDPLFSGVRCADPLECLSGVCDAGFCRCVVDTDCCAGPTCAAAWFVCEAPPPGTPGLGNTCRASRPTGTVGIRVFGDGGDNWVRARMVWNQHAYFVTNVREDGIVPRTSEMAANWLDPELNNFRQNVAGNPVPGAAPDLTTTGSPLVCDELGARMTARICNRGTEPVGSGVTVGFYVGDPAAGGTRICDGASVHDLVPGHCELIECPWPDAPRTGPGPDVWVVADADGVAGECHERNNVTVFVNVSCETVF